MNITPRHRNAVLGMAVLAAAGLAVAGCGSSSSAAGSKTTSTNSATSGAAASTGATTVTTGTVAGLGPVLENAQGRVLYIRTPDGTSGVTCTGGCASTWPPLLSSGTTTASGAAKASLLGSTANPAGGTVVTYAGRPLYAYVGDTSAGTANGQGTGGIWFVVSPTGTVVKTSAGGGSSTSPTSTGSSGGGYGY
jgi:predicted lipoprotein with Yx(FWY)xxD motif